MTPEEWLTENVYEYAARAEHFPNALPQAALRFNSFAAMKQAVEASGSAWFARDTLQWHSSRLYPSVWVGNRFFITSEEGPAGDRIFRVHWVYRSDSNRLQVSSFLRHYKTKREAYIVAHTALAHVNTINTLARLATKELP